MALTVSIEGVKYEFSLDRLMWQEAKNIQIFFGLTLPQLNDGLQNADVNAIGALVWLLKTRAGEQVNPKTMDFNLAALEIFDSEAEAGIVQGAEQLLDPTSPPPKPRRAATTSDDTTP